MKEVNDFMDVFCEKEKIMEEKFRKEDIDGYNKIVDNLLFMSTEELPLARKKSYPLTTIEKWGLKENADISVNRRHIYKISEYQNQKYGKLWTCYVSDPDPGEGFTQLLVNCFIVAKIDNLFKIIAQFDPDYITKEWEIMGGDDDLNYYDLGELIKVERFMSPINDEWSIEEYKKEN